MINYIIQVMLFQTLFLAVYDLALSKETFFSKNRWYLMITAIGSFLIPLIKLPNFGKAVPQEINILLPEIVLSPQSVIEKSSIYQSFNYGSLIFWTGFSLASLLFIYKLYKLIRLMSKNSAKLENGYFLISIPSSKKAFSFFNCVFIGDSIHEDEKEKIIAHELIHCKQKHSLDLLIFESLKIVMWFNPLLYIYQRRVSTVHEYISDSIVVKSVEKKEYLNNLVNQLFDVEKISFVNQFYKSSLMKKRIVMITKEKSKQIKQIKYLLLIPVLISMVAYTSCSSSQSKRDLELENQQLRDSLAELKRKDSIQLATIDYIKRKSSLEAFKNLGIAGETGEVSFVSVDKIPTFPDCSENDKKCFNQKMQRHFASNFNTDLPNKLGLSSGRKRIVMLFKIDTTGDIIDIKVKAPHEDLEKESIRIIKLLPKMTPGEHKNKVVAVKYTLPMRIDVK